MHATEKLSTWTLQPHKVYRSELAVRQAKLLVLDSIGCACAALEADAAFAVMALVEEIGGRAEATVIGMRDKTSVLNAVLVNGALVRVLDLNDVMFTTREGHLSVSGHRSDNIPVALAMAEKCVREGGEVIEAIILNYELYGRLRNLMPESAPWDGASASGIVAAAMSGKLLGLDAERQAHALALAAARSATPKIVRNGDISATKSLANAFVAEAGVQAALLAAKGVTGPLEILDDRKAGLFQVFDPDLGLEQLWAPYPPMPQILGAHMKSFPSIGTSQTAVQAALDLHAVVQDRLGEVDLIEVTMADLPAVRRQQADRSRRFPRSREAADHSFAFLVAIALHDGALSHHQFESERWQTDPRVRTLMECVALEVSDELAARAPGSMPCRLRVRLRSGKEFERECLFPRGHSFPDHGLDTAVIEEKFFRASHGAFERSAAEGIRSDVMALERTGALASLMDRLSWASRS
jgi:2-methylcitrate dehydratase